MWVLSLLLIALPSAVAESHLDAGKRLYREARFDDAAQELELFLRTAKPNERVDAALLLGASYVALGKDAPARRAFVDALDSDATATLPARSSPKLREAFDKAKAEFAALPGQLRWAEPAAIESPLGLGSRLRLRTRNVVGKPYALTLFWRTTNEASFQSASIDVRPDGTATVDVQPAGRDVQVEIALFVEAREGNTLRLSLGSAERPTIAVVPVRRTSEPVVPPARVSTVVKPPPVAVPPPSVPVAVTKPAAVDESAETPVYKKAWFWGVVGGAVAVGAAAVIIGVVVANQSSKPTSGDLRVGFEVAQ